MGSSLTWPDLTRREVSGVIYRTFPPLHLFIFICFLLFVLIYCFPWSHCLNLSCPSHFATRHSLSIFALLLLPIHFTCFHLLNKYVGSAKYNKSYPVLCLRREPSSHLLGCEKLSRGFFIPLNCVREWIISPAHEGRCKFSFCLINHVSLVRLYFICYTDL